MRVYKYPGYSYVTVAEIPYTEVDHVDFDVCAQPSETLQSYYNRQTVKPTILVNAGLFDMKTGNPVGTLVLDGKTYSSSAKNRTGMGTAPNDNKHLVYDVFDNRRWKDFVNGYPPLIAEGKALTISTAKELDYNARRTFIGYNDTTVFVVCVDNPGCRYSVQQKIGLALGMKYAINLDGGGSTRMLYNGKLQTSANYNRKVDNVFAVYTTGATPEPTPDPEKKVDYYVKAKVALNVRTQPTPNSSLAYQVSKDSVHHISAEATSSTGCPIWGKLDDGNWLPDTTTYITKVDKPSTRTVDYNVKTKMQLNVRSEPNPSSSTSKVMYTLPAGTIRHINAEADSPSGCPVWGKLDDGYWLPDTSTYVTKI